MKVDVIVNSAHPTPEIGGGVDAAIHNAAGPMLLSARKTIGVINTGRAYKTDAYNLNAKYVIHTVGPVWQDGDHNEGILLRDCYWNSLMLAEELKCNSIAFPLISAGVFGYPIAEAIQVASRTIQEFLEDHEMSVYLVVYEHEPFRISKIFSYNVLAYVTTADINNIYHERYSGDVERKRAVRLNLHTDALYAPEESIKKKLIKRIQNPEATFTETLFHLIDERNLKDVEVYKKANIDKRLFSKIRSNLKYQPSKTTAIALAIALELNLDETLDLIGRAGFTLSRSNAFDIIIVYFISEGIYNIYDVNEALFDYNQPLLGSL